MEDYARRLVRLMPATVRVRMRNLASRSDRRQPPPIQDWSEPLIAKPHGIGAFLDGAGTAAFKVDEPAQLPMPKMSAAQGGLSLRCLLVTSALDVGGMDEMVAFLACRLPTQGIRTAVLHINSYPSAIGLRSGRLARMLLAGGIEVYEGDEVTAPDLIGKFRPDIISTHGAPDWVLDIAQAIGVPSVDNLHGMHTLFGADWQAEARRSTKLTAIVAVSSLVRHQYLAGNSHFVPDRILVIPNGVDDERRSLRDREASRKRLGLTNEYLFVSLARYCMQKNPYGLLDAFGEVAESSPDTHLVIAGRPDDTRYYRRVLQKRDSMPCSKQIHLRDHAASPSELLAAADGFVLNSFFEGWPLASMEALFTGVPVVLSDVGGAREQVGEGHARGYLVGNPLGDPLAVDWESLSAACYRRQVNRDELVAAMRLLVQNRESYLLDRPSLAFESAERFSPSICLARHAALLHAAAVGAVNGA